MLEKNKETLKAFIERIWNKGNLEETEKFVFFPYTIHSDPGDPWEFQQLDLKTFKERVDHSHKVFPDQHFILEDLIAEDNKVFVRWCFKGTHEGDIPGLPATGKPVKVLGLTLYEFKEGKICGHWQVVDRLGFWQQVNQN